VFEQLKDEAVGRIDSIPTDLAPPSCDVLRQSDSDHAADDAEALGAIARQKCTEGKPTDDIIATVASLGQCSQGETGKRIAKHHGTPSEGKRATKPDARDIIDEVCRDKGIPRTAFEQFGPEVVRRGRERSHAARVAVYDHRGEKHSHFDLVPGHVGRFAYGEGKSGMFFPGRLPQSGETWHVVRGCENAAAIVDLGFNAAGMPGDCLPAKFAELFRGCRIVLVPDPNEGGRTGAQRTGRHLQKIAASVRIAKLPAEIKATKGENVRDVLARIDGDMIVRQAIANAEPWQPREGEHDAKEGRPEILVTLDYGWVCDKVTKHLGKLGWESPWIPQSKRERLKLYQRGGTLVHVVKEAKPCELAGGITTPGGTSHIRSLPTGQLPLRISDAVQLLMERETAEGIERVATPPPKWLIDGIFTRGDFGEDISWLAGIITAPTIRADGSILQSQGYDKRTGILYMPSDKFPKVPEKPTRQDAQAAAAELLEVIADVEFVADADRSAWLALVLTLIGRQSVAGCCPLFGVSATTPGSGKGLVVDAASIIAFGQTSPKKTFDPDDAEIRKCVTTTAMEALASMMLDNVDCVLQGSSLDAALTTTSWSDRVLGSNKTTGALPLLAVWICTGNNLQYGSDLRRRVLPIRLSPSVENPEERADFRHPKLLGWVQENRPRLAVAALTILRAYFAAGRPEQRGGVWGSFESWSEVVRGCIVWAGLADPLKTRETAKAEDRSGAIIRGLIHGLREIDEHGDGLTVRDIVKALEAVENVNRFPVMQQAVAEVATHRGTIDQQRLGYAFRRYRGRIAAGWKIECVPGHGGVMKWAAMRANGGDASADTPCNVVCVTSTHDGSHLGEFENAGEETYQPSQPNGLRMIASKHPCPTCGGQLARKPDTPIVNGWVNLDCVTPGCSNVKAIRMPDEVAE